MGNLISFAISVAQNAGLAMEMPYTLMVGLIAFLVGILLIAGSNPPDPPKGV